MATNKAAVPKRIGGVRLPKPLRQSLKKLRGSKSGRARIAEALAAASGALAAKPPAPAARRRASPKMAPVVSAAKARAKPRAKSPAPTTPRVKRPPLPALAARPTPDVPTPDVPAPGTAPPPSGNGAGN